MQTITRRPARAARLFHALSDQTRLRVIDLLSSGEKCVCELQNALGAAQSRLSFHLKVLREAGLVNDKRIGRQRRIRGNPDAIRTAQQLLASFEQIWRGRIDRLDALLAED